MMASRKKLIQLLIYFFSSFNFSFSDIIIKNNTEWLRNKNITQNVIVKPGATLTIKEDVSIYIHNENKESENSGIQFIISGTLKILGSRQNPIFIGPKSKSNDKNYWQGLKFDSTQSGSVIEFLELSNATNALDIRSPIKVTNSTIKSSGGNALSINSESSDSISFSNIEIFNSEGVSLFIEKGNVNIDWLSIAKGVGPGIVNNTFGMINLRNVKIINNSDNGIINHGHLTASNLFVSQNRHGLVLTPGISVITYATITNNRLNGLLIGGGSNVNMEHCTIEQNGGFGLEITNWSKDSYESDWEEKNDPYLYVVNSNFIDNYKSSALDKKGYTNIWPDWNDAQYEASGWVSNYETKIKRKVPFGRLGWVSFDYNSNDGGSEFSWQPCTGKGVWSPIFEIQNSREQTITYLDSPFQCGWNPLAGRNSDTWLQYEKFTGLIDSTDEYSDWVIRKKDLPSSNVYYLRHHFMNTYVPKIDSVSIVNPVVKDFELRFYHGGQEISSYASDHSNIFIDGNHWSSAIKSEKLINKNIGDLDLEIQNTLENQLEKSHSNIQNDVIIEINSPTKGLAYQEVKMVEISWETNGWLPLVDIFVSSDGGSNWVNVADDIPNEGKFNWWNNLIVGDSFLIKIANSNNPTYSSVVGPCKVIVNKTPVLVVPEKPLNFITETSKLNFPIINNGGGLLMWSLSAKENWIYFDKKEGSAKKRSICTATVKRSGLKTGKYKAEIIVNSNVGTKKIPVELIVAKPSLYLDTKYVSFDSTKTAQVFNIKNYGGGTLTWTIEPNVNWLKAVPSEGIVQSATTVKILIDRSRLKIGDNETVLTLTTNVGEKQIDVEAFRPKSFVQDTIRTDFSPWQWMYRYDVY